MTHYILVHGAWEGAWSWNLTQPVLEKAGHKVTAVDLAGSPGNKSDIAQVTMESYIETVTSAINGLDHNIVLVGHSLAGAIISQVAERIPEKIDRLVYVTAFLLENGDSIIEAMQRDPDGEFLSKLNFVEDQTYATADEKTWRDIAFHDVREGRILDTLPRVIGTKQATEPFMAKVTVSEERFGSVPKTYIRTALDKMVSPKLQDEMLSNWNVDKIYTVQSGHFPTLSLPETLAELIL
jgi:pimeloyl-ACP methyl ester carboxylesterase